MFEVTSAGDLVWEYASPLMSGNYISDTMGVDVNGKPLKGGPGMGTNAVFRSHRYAPDFSGLAGKPLVSQGTFTKPATSTVTGFGGTGGGATVTGGGGSTGAGGGAAGGY
jgi:hypothetical protein